MPFARFCRPALLPLCAAAVAALAGCANDGDDDGREVSPAGERLFAVLPTVAVRGEPVDLKVTPLTDIGAPSATWSADLKIESSDRKFLADGEFERLDTATRILRGVTFGSEGVHRVRVEASDGLVTVAGPVRVVDSEEALRPRAGEPLRRPYWGDAHGHSNVGDGIYEPVRYFFYAREVSHLDFTCLSEHDYQKFLEVGLDESEAGWEQIAALAKKWRRPDFAVLLGWEWSSRKYGHRVVLFPDDASRYVSFRDAESPTDLAERLRGTGAVSVLAHPVGSQLTPPIDWDEVVPGFDRAVEIYSGHGTMDEDRNYRPTSDPDPSASALESIRRGMRLGFVGFSDTHMTTPGNPNPPPIRDAPYPGGMTAVLARSRDEREILAAIAAGHTYATSGERFYVEFRVEDRISGETLSVPADRGVVVTGRVAAKRAFVRIEVMAGETVARTVDPGGGDDVEFVIRLEDLAPETAVWLRGDSEDGERFWTTPVWVLSG